MGIYDDVAGALDNAASSTDEAVARTLDDEPGGGVVDGAQEFADSTGISGALDNAAGLTDEAVARTFNDEPGGGVVDGYQEYAGSVWGPVGGAASDAAGDAVDSAADATGLDVAGALDNWKLIGGGVVVVILRVVVAPYADLLAGVTD